MEELTSEARTIYELLKGDVADTIDKWLTEQRDDMVKAVRKMLDEMSVSLEEDITKRVDAIWEDLAGEIAQVCVELDKGLNSPQDAKSVGMATPRQLFSSSVVRPVEDQGGEKDFRGKGDNLYVPPLARGLNFSWGAPSKSIANRDSQRGEASDNNLRVELSRFDGTNPQLWQTRCEDHFQLWHVSQHVWVPLASAQFEGAITRWLESVQRRSPRITWEELCNLLHTRFARNQHQQLIRRLLHISQTITVEDYVERFSELYDQLTAYETAPDPLHYVARFMDGLKPIVRLQVAVQKPKELDTSYELALPLEEIGDGHTPINTPAHRRGVPVLTPTPTRSET